MSENAERMFLAGRFNSVPDIDAALATCEVDDRKNICGFVARITFSLYETLIAPSLFSCAGEWGNLSRRLQAIELVLLPSLPSAYELSNGADISIALKAYPYKFAKNAGGELSLSQITPDETVLIRTQDLAQVVEQHRGRSLMTVDGGHFELPSGAHTSHFFRLAECFASASEVDTLLYWICRDFLNFVLATNAEQKILLVVDNPSMLILAVRLTQIFCKWQIIFECIKSYPEIQSVADDLDIWLQPRASGNTHLFWIVGVSSTGNLTSAVEAAAKRVGLIFSYSVIYSTIHQAPHAAYCNLQMDDYKHSLRKSDCTLCQDTEKSSLFQIDRARYFIGKKNVEVIPLPLKLFNMQRPFLGKYGSSEGVLNTHVLDPNDETPRHHAFYINVSKLLDNPEFCNEVIDRINSIEPRPDLVIIPPHVVGKKIAEIISTALGLTIHFHSNLRIDKSNEKDKNLARKLSAANSLLIIDDLAFTGKRIQNYNVALREAGGTYDAPSNVTFFPLISLPTDANLWGKMQRGIESSHPGQIKKIIFLYQFLMPDWGRSHCPWCVELREIERLDLFEGNFDADIRGTRLANMESGLVQNAWLNCVPSKLIPTFGNQSEVLQAGASAVQILFACASAVQQARVGSEGVKKLNAEGFPKATVLDVAVVKDYFNEMLFVVSLLRCLLPNEVDTLFKEHVLQKSIEIAQGVNHHELWALRELLLAGGRGLGSFIEDDSVRLEVHYAAQLHGFNNIDDLAKI